MTTNISLLPLQQVTASVEADEDFAPPPILFFQSDGVTPIDLTGIAFTAWIGNNPALTSAFGGAIAVSGNSVSFFVAASAKEWPTGRYSFTLLASDGTFTRDIFANSTLTVGAPAAFSVSALAGAGSSVALSGLSGAALEASILAMSPSQQQAVAAVIGGSAASPLVYALIFG